MRKTETPVPAPGTTEQPPSCRACKDGFAWWEKLLVRGAVAGIVGLGFAAMFLSHPAAAAGYLAFVAVGGLWATYDLFCVYCPYPYEHRSCLFFPPVLLTAVVPRRRGPIPAWRKAMFLVVAAGLVFIPQYWLWPHRLLLAAFWTLAVPLGACFPLYFCPRCRHVGCPMSQASRLLP